MPEEGATDPVLVEASRYAAEKDAGKFLGLKRHLGRYLVKKYATTSDRVEVAVPGPGCYIVHIIVVGYKETEESEELVFTLDELVDALHTAPEEERRGYTRPEWLRRLRLLRELGRRVLPCLRRAAERHDVAVRSPEDARRLLDEHYREILRCATRRLRAAGCRVEELGLIRRFRCTVAVRRRTRTVRHAVRLVAARERPGRTGTRYVVRARIPARLRRWMGKAYVHVLRGACPGPAESGTDGPGEQPGRNPQVYPGQPGPGDET